MIGKLIVINDKIISQTLDEEKRAKHLLIKKMLNDKQCFFKINIETAYALLRELEIPENDLKSIYLELIDSEKMK